MDAKKVGKAAFPTAVGMNRGVNVAGPVCTCVPHSRGDEPRLILDITHTKQRSPQPWG